MHVLVVEDDRETAQFLQKALKESGAKATEARRRSREARGLTPR